jgi:hypothetical protein
MISILVVAIAGPIVVEVLRQRSHGLVATTPAPERTLRQARRRRPGRAAGLRVARGIRASRPGCSGPVRPPRCASRPVRRVPTA